MKYKYVARDVTGNVIKGSMEADGSAGAAGALRERKLIPITVIEDKPVFSGFNLKFGGVSFEDVTNFTRQLSTMITAGLPLTDALNLLKVQSSPAFKPIVGSILSDVQGGVSLSESMSKHPKVFSKVYVALVRAGEAAGVMETILNRLADNLEKSREFKAKFKAAMIYPVIILVGMVGVMVLMMVVVVPKLTQIYSQFNADLPVATKIVIGISNFMTNFWWLAAIMAVGLVYGIRAYLQTKDGQRRWDSLKYKLPIIGPLSRQVMLTEISRTLSLLLGAGVSIVEALNIVSEALGNVVVEQEVKLIAKRVEKGFPVSVGFAETAEFPPIVSQMMAVGEETGKMDDVLLKLAKYYESESDEAVKGLTTAIEPIILVVLGLGVGFLMFSIILPLYNITNQI